MTPTLWSYLAPLLPAASFLLLFLRVQAYVQDPRRALLGAAVAFGVCLAVLTELLSVPRMLTRGALGMAWGGVGLGLAIWQVCTRSGAVPPEPGRSIGPAVRREILVLSGIATLCTLTAVSALGAPPNTWDSMTYHMSRVAHWAQNEGVGVYPTHIPRQLYLAPWSEFAILHAQLLTGGDRLANLVQWFSMVGCLVGVSVVARQLGAGTAGQAFAALATASIPMGVLQASSTQNDYVLAFWLTCTAHYALRVRDARARGEHAPAAVAGLAGSAALAILTKGTAYLFAFPFVVAAVLPAAASAWRAAVGTALAVGACVLLLNSAHYHRNVTVFGSPIGPVAGREPGEDPVVSSEITLPLLASSVVRNVAIHLGTPLRSINRVVERAVEAIHKPLGVATADPRTTWPGLAFEVPRFSFHEDYAGNPAHLVLIGLTAALWLWEPAVRKDRRLAAYAACVLGGALLFAMLVRWQPWHSRLHLPLFVTGSAWVAAVLGRTAPARAVRVAVLLLLTSGVLTAVLNASRPLVGRRSILVEPRTSQYFQNRPDLRADYEAAAAAVKASGCRAVGLVAGVDDWEYPLWVYLNGAGKEQQRIEHVLVANGSSVAYGQPRFASFRPCTVLALGRRAGEASSDQVAGLPLYTAAGSIAVYGGPLVVPR